MPRSKNRTKPRRGAGRRFRRKTGKKLSKQHRDNISIALERKYRNNKPQGKPDKYYTEGKDNKFIQNAESASRIVRNLSLSMETPSKIARNTSVAKRNLSNITYGIDRNLKRVGQGTSSLENLSKSGFRGGNYILKRGDQSLKRANYLLNKQRYGF